MMTHALTLFAALLGVDNPLPIGGSGHAPTRVEVPEEPMLATLGNAARPPVQMPTETTTWISQFGSHEIITVGVPTDKPGDLTKRHIAELREAQKTLAPIASPTPTGGR